MGKYDGELLPAAYADLDEIFDYIMVDSLIAKSIFTKVDSLSRTDTKMAPFAHLKGDHKNGLFFSEKSNFSIGFAAINIARNLLA